MLKDNFAVGVDIENVKRFQKFEKTDPFLQRVFNETELVYCFSKTNPAPHLAVRYAGKEAVVKALNGMVEEDIDYKDICIERNVKGAPIVKMNGYDNLEIKISFSHTNETAIAFCIIRK